MRTILAVLLAVASWLSLEILPTPQKIDASPDRFSAERAFRHIKRIAQQPRTLGSIALESTRSYLIEELSELGCQLELQETTAVTQWGSYVYTAPIQNILCTFPGKKEASLMLMSHYDSVHNSPGASDSATGTALLLETARALRDTKFENTLLLLFTDGEESGLKGSSAFVREKLFDRKHVKFILNFEARGNSGPLALFETLNLKSTATPALKQLRRPVGNSFLDFLYQFLPNDTDVSNFKETGVTALNFAFAKGLQHYHHSSDTPEKLSLSTLQHAGDTALSLSHSILRMDLSAPAEASSRVFQDVLSLFHFNYPSLLVKALAVMALIALLVLVTKQRTSFRTAFKSTILSSLFFFLTLTSAFFLHKLFTVLYGAMLVVIYFYFFFALSLLLSFPLLYFLFRKLQRTNVGLSLFLFPPLALLFVYPELAPLILWPSLGVLTALLWPKSWTRTLALLPICISLPGLLHAALIADSGTQLILPTLIALWIAALLDLLFFDEKRAYANLSSRTLVYVLGIGLFLLSLPLVGLLPSNDLNQRSEYFELVEGGSFYVAVGRRNSVPSFAEKELSSSERDYLFQYLGVFWLYPERFRLFQTSAPGTLTGEAAMSLWEEDQAASQYLIDVPPQPYDCVHVYLHPFEKMIDFRVNGRIPFQIPRKKFSSPSEPQIVESCNLRELPLRIEFKVPPGQTLPTETIAIFSKGSPFPRDLKDGGRRIWGRSAQKLYVIKKIIL